MNIRCATLFTTVIVASCAPPADEQRLVGQLESDRIEIAAEFAEVIRARHVVEGEAVAAGSLLISQDSERIDARIAEADAVVSETRARLAELTRGPRREQILAAQANVEGAQKEFNFRDVELNRFQDLFERELASQELRDRAQTQFDTARANLDSREAQLDELLNGTTVEELRQAEAALAGAIARVESLQVERARHQYSAPIDAMVDSLLFEAGERPGIGQPIAILLSGAQPFARIYVPEALRVHVGPGSKAQIYVDGLQTPVAGVVRWVASEAAFTPYFALTEDDRGRLSFEAKVDIVDYPRRLPDGVPVEVTIDGSGG